MYIGPRLLPFGDRYYRRGYARVILINLITLITLIHISPDSLRVINNSNIVILTLYIYIYYVINGPVTTLYVYKFSHN